MSSFYKIAWGVLLSVSMLLSEEIEVVTKPIVFSGQEAFSESDLQKEMGVENKSFFEFWKSDDPKINVSLLPTLEASIKSFYQSEGFYDATCEVKEDDNGVAVKIKENKAVIIRDINISSDFKIGNYIVMKTSQRFRTDEFIKSKEQIIGALLKHGYCSYELDTKAYVDIEKHSVDIAYQLKKGGVCTFGKVTVKGLETIDEPIVHSRVNAREGERYNLDRVQESYENLGMLESFDSVLIDVNRKFYNVVPVDIAVKERTKLNHFQAGVGYDTYVGMRVHGDYTRNNFLGNAQKVMIKAAWSQNEQMIETSFYRPVLFTLFDYDIDFGAKIGYSNLEYVGFTEKKTYTGAFLEYNYARLKLRAGLSLENINIVAHDVLSNEILLQAVTEGTFLLTYPYLELIYDARDSKLNPKYGYYLSSYLEYGLANKDGASDYVKMLLEGRAIYSFGDLTLATVGKIGAIDVAEGGLPESKFFFGGGSYSNRAYGYREMGVIIDPEHYSIYGASSWLNMMVEANYPIWGEVYGAVFGENTMLNEAGYDFSGESITAAGVGVRYMTPIGPFKLDVGFNTQDTSQYRVLFQIGHSF